MSAPTNERHACLCCGRDTLARSAICSRCLRPGGGHEEQIGRKARATNVLASDLFGGLDGHAFRSDRLYHGVTFRDDI